MITYEDAPPAAPTPRAWPHIPRREMGDKSAIRARMAADMVTLAEEVGGVEPWHMTSLGWTRAQVDLHAAAASEIAGIRQAGTQVGRVDAAEPARAA